MKTLFATLSLLFILNTASAQDWPEAGTYISNTSMTRFHGTWQWTSGIDTIRLYLTTQKIFNSSGDFYRDVIVGWHTYKRGNAIIETNENMAGQSYNNGINVTLLGANDLEVNVLKCFLTDLSKNKAYVATLAINPSQNQLTWKSREGGTHVYGPNDVVPPPGLTLPRSMTFNKL